MTSFFPGWTQEKNRQNRLLRRFWRNTPLPQVILVKITCFTPIFWPNIGTLIIFDQIRPVKEPSILSAEGDNLYCAISRSSIPFLMFSRNENLTKLDASPPKWAWPNPQKSALADFLGQKCLQTHRRYALNAPFKNLLRLPDFPFPQKVSKSISKSPHFGAFWGHIIKFPHLEKFPPFWENFPPEKRNLMILPQNGGKVAKKDPF